MYSRCPSLSGCCKTSSVISDHLERSLPYHIYNVEVRYKLPDSDLGAACSKESKLPFEVYVQSSEKLGEYILQRWINASPVEGHCCRSPAYQTFPEPHPDYRHLSLYGKPALHKGERPSKKNEVPFLENS
jgi:hypothetical protein